MGARRRRQIEGVGTAYRIRTGDLRLERAVSWASRRMRLRAAATACRGRIGMIPTDRLTSPTGGARLGAYRRCASRNPRIASATCWWLCSPTTSP